AEVTHFNASRRMQNSFLKTYTVNWPVNAVLMEALRERLTQMGLVPVAAGATEALSRSREGCFLNAALAKGLPKGCGPLFAQLAAAEHVDAIIVLGPGLNDSAHAGDSRRRQLPQYLRGWCVLSEEGGAQIAPALLNLTELLLIGLSARGAELGAREWGGQHTQPWAGFKSPPDVKDIPEQQLSQLLPLFAAMLKQQADGLLGHLRVTR
ncbi:MAG TPA: hypothetical protein VGD47_09635, partial [Steroidobacteraceae bacterium]